MNKNIDEVFRHLRPLEVSVRHTLIPQKNGGISFLCSTTKKTHFDFWVYICPFDAGFSPKGALNKLRLVKAKVSPWGVIELDDRPLIEQLCDAVSRSELPTKVTQMLVDIQVINYAATLKLESIKNKSVLGLYATD